jgi:prepilin-type N-terminal cleavage/methylation domain-containing protein
MPTLSVGRTSNPRRKGVTLLEMVVVVTLIGILAGISYPSVASGIDSLRLRSAGDSVAGFLNASLSAAERSQHVVEISISRNANMLEARSTDPRFRRRLELGEEVRIVAVYPEAPAGGDAPRRILLYPGGRVPQVGVRLENRRGRQKDVRIDPLIGAPLIEDVRQ